MTLNPPRFISVGNSLAQVRGLTFSTSAGGNGPHTAAHSAGVTKLLPACKVLSSGVGR